MINLATTTFWLVCLLGIALLVPLTSAPVRKWWLAGLNLLFLLMLFGTRSVAVIGALLIAYLLLQWAARPSRRVVIGLAAGFVMVGLFVVHKLPGVADRLALGALGRALALLGYSYLALRLADVLRAVIEQRHSAPDLPSTVNYLLPFHMLAAGPIQGYDEFVRHAPAVHAPSAREVLIATERVTRGLFKKFVIAFILQKLFLTDFRAPGPYFLLELQVFFVWLYVDFSAYSDIAVGVGALIGVATPENFNRPLLARNMVDFWERWHISLSMFIRRNIFIPLQMAFMRWDDARRPLLCSIVAVAISFFLCGLWHGLTIGFLIWGVAQATGVVTARLYGHVLQRTLGTKALKVYLANPWIRIAAIALTFEFQALASVTLFMS